MVFIAKSRNSVRFVHAVVEKHTRRDLFCRVDVFTFAKSINSEVARRDDSSFTVCFLNIKEKDR